MKRKIAALLTLVFILTLALPLQSFAAEMDKELENAIRVVKTKFSIPDDYKFTSSISTSGTQKIYYLSWSSNDELKMSSINASVDDKGMILNYNKYTPDDYKQTKKLPSLSREEAKAKAEAYIENIVPGLLKEIKHEDNYQDSIMDSSYYFNYYRVVNGVPYYDNRVSVTINRETGDLQGYSRNWSAELEFPSSKGAVSLEKAEAAYVKNLGLRLIYSYTAEDDVLKAFPLYEPVYNNNNYAVNAFTGERYRLTSAINMRGKATCGSMISFKQSESKDAGAIQLSPEEIKAVEEAAMLIDQQGAEKLARTAAFLNIPDDYELQNYYLNTSWPDKEEYIWTLNFVKPSEDKKLGNEYYNVSLNAKTGVIMSFYKNSANTNDKKQPINDIAKVKAATDKFLSEYYPQYFKLLEYDKISSEEYLTDSTLSDSYNLRYTRLANGVPFPENGASFSYDNLNGEITGFDLSWFNIEFPSVDKVIGLTAAADSLFDKVGLGMEYRYEYPVKETKIVTNNEPSKGKTALAYLLEPGKPLYIDAASGNVVYSNGKEYKEATKTNYTDIKGHFAEKQISVLADFGIYLDGSKFRPSEKITQKDFLTYLSTTVNYYGQIITASSTQKDVNDMYAFMVREGIIKEAEMAPGSAVTREEAVKYIVRALKYDKVADIKGIFSLSFKDKASISKDLYGYVAIASGLGIVSGDGGKFYPKRNITRGESAVIIYNYLQQ